MAWWEDTVVYQVYPRSFADSDADGEGDLDGLRSRLSHLTDLGVGGLWVSPFYPSPQRDGGYDVTDYCAVDRRLGDLDAFDALVKEAAGLGLRVLVDIVPNHCSVEHPLFQKALAAGRGSAERDLFIFRDRPNNWPSYFGGSAWTQVDDGQYYLHLFDRYQVDWNWRNPRVQAMFQDVLRFWLDRGVAGFRIDVSNGLFKAEGLPDVDEDVAERVVTPGDDVPFQDQPELDEHYRRWRDILDSYGEDGFPGQRIMVGENWADEQAAMQRWVEAGMHQTFDFRLIGQPWSASVWRDKLGSSLQDGLPARASPWVLGNHDVPRLVTRLGLESVHDLDELYDTLQPDADVDLDRGTLRARAAAVMLLGLPGPAFVYQGDELGLPEHLHIPKSERRDPMFHRGATETLGRDGCRVPMAWSGDRPPYGFTADGVSTWLPQPDDWGPLTVERQRDDPASTFSLYRTLIALRSTVEGKLEWQEYGEDVLAYRRGSTLCLANFSDEPVSLPAHREVVVSSAPVVDGELPGNSAVWLRT